MPAAIGKGQAGALPGPNNRAKSRWDSLAGHSHKARATPERIPAECGLILQD